MTVNAMASQRAGLVSVLSGLTTPAGKQFARVWKNVPNRVAPGGVVDGWVEYTGVAGIDRPAPGIALLRWQWRVGLIVWAQDDFEAVADLEDDYGQGVVNALLAHVRGGVSPASGVVVTLAEIGEAAADWLEIDGGRYRYLSWPVTLNERTGVTLTD